MKYVVKERTMMIGTTVTNALSLLNIYMPILKNQNVAGGFKKKLTKNI